MGKTFKGDTLGKGLRIGIAVSRFNEPVTTRLLDGALEGLNANGVSQYAVDVAWTPGALELPIVAKQMAGSGRYDAIICLGAVIRGETAHFDYVSAGAQQGVVKASLKPGSPSCLESLLPTTRPRLWNAPVARRATRASTPPPVPSRWPTS